MPENRASFVIVIQSDRTGHAIQLVANANVTRDMPAKNVPNAHLALKVHIVRNVHVMHVGQWKAVNASHIVNARYSFLTYYMP